MNAGGGGGASAAAENAASYGAVAAAAIAGLSKVPLGPSSNVATVAESTFDLLHVELVHYMTEQIKRQPGAFDLPAKVVRQHAYARLETMGFQVGFRLAERLTKDHAWLNEQLDVIKFMCKDFWTSVFKKQVDKLQTNYKGTYVLHDTSFRLLARIHALSVNDEITVLDEAHIYTAYSCGLIRGALHNLGVIATVKADLAKLPACQFTIEDVEKTRKGGGASATTTNTTTAAPTTATATTNTSSSVARPTA